MARFLLLISLLWAPIAFGKPLIVVVVDTGFGFNMESLLEKHLCKYGHKDFTKDKEYVKVNTVDPVPKDSLFHGTHIVGIIDKFAEDADYCLVIVKFFSGKTGSIENDKYFQEAVIYATGLKPDFINISAGGVEYDKIEFEAIEKYLNGGGTLVAASGNNSEELGINGHTFYPAMYDDRIYVVGNLDEYGNRHYTSNYGKPVKNWEVGTNVGAFGLVSTGSSQATATFSGKLIKKRKHGTQNSKTKKAR